MSMARQDTVEIPQSSRVPLAPPRPVFLSGDHLCPKSALWCRRPPVLETRFGFIPVGPRSTAPKKAVVDESGSAAKAAFSDHAARCQTVRAAATSVVPTQITSKSRCSKGRSLSGSYGSLRFFIQRIQQAECDDRRPEAHFRCSLVSQRAKKETILSLLQSGVFAQRPASPPGRYGESSEAA